MGVENQIPSLAALFSLSGPGFLDLNSPSVYDVSTGKLSSGAEVFSDAAQTVGWEEMWLALDALFAPPNR